jgi:predicted histone-like DNA-binding protein
MSVIIKKIQNTNESNTKTNGKWYPRVVNIGTMNLDALCEHIQEHGSLWTEDVVTGVVKKFVRCIQEQLLESRKVKLDGLGTFYLKARLKVGNGEEGQTIYGGVVNEKDLLVQDVDFQVGFQPDMSDTSRFVGPNISRKAARKSITALGLTESEDEEENTNSGSGGNSGGSGSGNSNTDPNTPTEDIPGEDRP